MATSKPSKQRKILYNMAYHKRKANLVAPVSDEIEKEYGISKISIKKGDTVKVIRGEHAGFEGKVAAVDTKDGRISIEGLTRKKADGTPIYIWIHASKVMITKLDVADSKRKDLIERKKKANESPNGES
jgi:large subunit ribosomal protein L24